MTLATTSARIGRLEFPTSRVALELPAGLTFEEWKEIGIPLLEAGQSLMWWIGDWLNYGELEYRESYAAAAEWTGMEYQTLANAKWVCERVEVSRRREQLSFSHHAAVAALGRRSQTQLLNRAVKEQLTVQALRAEVKRANEELLGSSSTSAGRDDFRGEGANGQVSGGESVTLPDERKSSAGRRSVVGLRVTVAAGDEPAVRSAVDRAAAGLRDWFAGEGIDAKIDVTG